MDRDCLKTQLVYIYLRGQPYTEVGIQRHLAKDHGLAKSNNPSDFRHPIQCSNSKSAFWRASHFCKLAEVNVKVGPMAMRLTAAVSQQPSFIEV